jgi:hypothetical protein
MSDDLQAQLLAELTAAREHREASARRPGRHGWLRHLVAGLEDDPAVQARIHKWACVYWLANFPVIGVLYFFYPHTWIALGLLVNTFYSLYANFATDYGGLSAAQASMHAEAANPRKAGPE